MAAGGEQQHSSCCTEDTVQSSYCAKEEETGVGTAQQLLPCDSKCGTVPLHCWLLKKFNWDGATAGTTLPPLISLLLLQLWQVNTYLAWVQKIPALNQFPPKPTEQHRWGQSSARGLAEHRDRTGDAGEPVVPCWALLGNSSTVGQEPDSFILTFQHQKN